MTTQISSVLALDYQVLVIQGCDAAISTTQQHQYMTMTHHDAM